MKKELLLLAALCLASVQVQGQTTVDSGTCGAEAGGSNLTWTLTSDSTLTISGTGDMADFTSGNQPWEEHLAAIRTAVVQEGVTSVGDHFLYSCTRLTSIDLPDGLTSVGDYFLRGCTGLTSIDLPDGVTSVGDHFLRGCSGLTSIDLPDGLTSVGGHFLRGCSGLTSLTLPEGLSSVGDSFLNDCTGLTSLTLPAGLTSAGNYFLYDCTGLQELTVPAETPPAIGSERAFAGVDNTIPVYVPAGSIGTYASTVPWDRFSNYKAFIPSGTCGAEADGSNLTWTLTSDGTLTISGTGDMADFTSGSQPWEEHLTAIRTAVVQEGVTSVGDNFLTSCTGLTSVDLPAGLTSVGDYFLRGCTGLTSIDLPDGLTSVGSHFLRGCSGLTSLTLPEKLESEGGHFLRGCTGLTSLTLPAGLSSVGDSFLSGCTGLTSIDLPDGLTSVGNYFLYGCTGLTSLTLPAGLTSAGNYFLRDCTGLQELTVPAATPPVLGSEGAFAGVDKTIPVYVPAGSTEAYAMADGWDYFTDYRDGNSGIGTPSLAECITVAGGEVRLHLADNPGTHVYDLQGRLVLSTTACRFALPPGIYIIKVGDDTVKVAL